MGMIVLSLAGRSIASSGFGENGLAPVLLEPINEGGQDIDVVLHHTLGMQSQIC